MRVCDHCKIRFDPIQRTQRFCSAPCRVAAGNAKRNPKRWRDCEACGKPFLMKMPHQRFCNPGCRVRYLGTLKHIRTYTCKWCGREFEHLQNSQIMYCGEACRREARNSESPNGPSARNRRLTQEMRMWQDRLESWREENVVIIRRVDQVVASEDPEIQTAIEAFLNGGGAVVRYPLMEPRDEALQVLESELKESNFEY